MKMVAQAFGSAIITLVVGLVAAPAASPQEIWRLSGTADFEVGRQSVDLFRVSDAAFLPDGGVAIGDAGNRRILVFSADGQLTSAFGRDGSGPGEYRSVSAIYAFGDTLLVYDGVLKRVTLLHAGDLLSASALPTHLRRPTALYAAHSPGRLLLGASEASARSGRSRAFTEEVSLLLTEESGDVSVLARIPLAHRYFFVQESGATTYRLPFLSPAAVAAVPGGWAHVPLDSAVVEVHDFEHGLRHRIPLPIRHRPFPAELMDSVREQMLENARHPRFPGAVDRIRRMFADLPVPEFASPVAEMIVAGTHLWVKEFPLSASDPRTWYIVDPVAGTLLASLELPADMTLLAGDGRRIAVLTRDEMDVEVVEVFTVLK